MRPGASPSQKGTVGGAPWADGDATNAGGAYVFGMDSVVTYCTAKTSSAGCVASITTSNPFAQPVSGAGGYSVIAADSLDAAVAMAKGCPVLVGGGTVCVNETIDM